MAQSSDASILLLIYEISSHGFLVRKSALQSENRPAELKACRVRLGLVLTGFFEVFTQSYFFKKHQIFADENYDLS